MNEQIVKELTARLPVVLDAAREDGDSKDGESRIGDRTSCSAGSRKAATPTIVSAILADALVDAGRYSERYLAGRGAE